MFKVYLPIYYNKIKCIFEEAKFSEKMDIDVRTLRVKQIQRNRANAQPQLIN